MIYLPFTKIVDSSEANVAAGAVITAEGQALVRAVGAPASGVQQSMAASATELFAGFAIAGVSAAPFQALYATKVEEFVVPGSGIVALSTPLLLVNWLFTTTPPVPLWVLQPSLVPPSRL